MPLLLNGRVQVLTGEGLLTERGISEERIVALNPTYVFRELSANLADNRAFSRSRAGPRTRFPVASSEYRGRTR